MRDVDDVDDQTPVDASVPEHDVEITERSRVRRYTRSQQEKDGCCRQEPEGHERRDSILVQWVHRVQEVHGVPGFLGSWVPGFRRFMSAMRNVSTIDGITERIEDPEPLNQTF